MDGFELVRVAARKLREELSSAGYGLATSSDIVGAALRRLEVDTCPLTADDPLLKGARATFDHQGRLICYANDGNDAQRAVLIAHEIGHVRLHASSSACSEHDIDGAQPSEVAPVGLQRVEDYGGRERRELQANVFARELLLPRVDARRLYLDDQLGATAIAEKLVLPRELVTQQLLDALLLPEEQEQSRSEGPTLTADESQDRAARHRGSPFLLQAGPGTGKTRTLVRRVLGLLEDKVEPSSIAILTFSNRAAGEVYDRIAQVAPDASAMIWIGTFHAFGLDLVRRYHDRLDLPADPVLFDRSDGIAVLEEILPTLGLVHYRDLWNPARELRDMLVAISRAKDELIDAEGYRLLAQRMVDAAATDEARKAGDRALEVARVYALYERKLCEHGAVDFGDLVMRPTLLLERDRAVQVAVSHRHRHVLVDEYQDVNRASARMLRALSGDGKLLWAVGDSRQSIYRFRGASSVNMARFTEDYPTAATDQLSINYRSSPEIVKTLIAIAPQMKASKDMLPLAFEARSSSAPMPEIRRVETPNDEIEAIAIAIRELEADGVTLRDQAVLCRSNGRLNQIAAGLEARGVPVLHLGSIFERDEIRDMLALLSLVAGRLGDGLVRVGAMARYQIALQDVHTALAWLREQPASVARRLGQLATDAALTDPGREGIERLAIDIDGFHPGSSPWDVVTTYLLDRTRMLADLAVAQSIAGRVQALACWQFLNFVRQDVPGKGPRIRRLLDRVRMMVLFAEERDLRRVPAGALHMDAVRLMTVHGAKGLEFEAVHLPGMTVTSFPANPRGQPCPPPHGLIEGLEDGVDDAAKRAHGEEEECLFFVAVSRARRHLRLYAASKQANGKNRKASPYLEWLRGHAADRSVAVNSTTVAAASPHERNVEVQWPADWHVIHHKLKSHETCPRRFFYTHVLGLGTARSITAYTQTQDCLHEMIEWIARARAEGSIRDEEAVAKLHEIWTARGPAEHAFAAEYLQLAETMVRRLVRSGPGLRFRPPSGLTLDLESGRVVVEPDELAEDPDGTIVLRRVRPGTARKDEADRLEYKLLHLAAARAFETGHRVEVVHLTDDARAPIDLTTKKLASAETETGDALASIRAGLFPPKIDGYTCPQCPHFFICPSIPSGKLVPG
jgi:superfamily I DNA/RNA helicase/Zn-dependent peptidase ImmA (M78 family)